MTDPAVPRRPPKHPFLDVQADLYWTATVFADEPGFTMYVSFVFNPGSDAPIDVGDGAMSGGPKYAWAVRGPSPGPSNY